MREATSRFLDGFSEEYTGHGTAILDLLAIIFSVTSGGSVLGVTTGVIAVIFGFCTVEEVNNASD